MENYDAKEIVKKCLNNYRKWMLIFVVPALLITIIYWVKGASKNSIVLIIFIIYLVSVRVIVSSKMAGKYIHSILFQEMDPKKYKAVLDESKRNNKFGFDRINAAYFGGDYHTAIKICEQKLNDKKCKKYKHEYLICLARSYFELNDFEKLSTICRLFENDKEIKKESDAIAKKYPIIHFYQMYLKEDYRACKTFYYKIIENHKNVPYMLSEIQMKYIYAIACYKAGDIQEAKCFFEYIVQKASKLNFAVISQNYLELIETGKEYIVEKDVMIDDDFELEEVSKTHLGNILFYFLCIFIILLIQLRNLFDSI